MNGPKITRRGVLTIGGAAAVAATAGVSVNAFAATTTRTFYVGSYGSGVTRGTQDPATGKLTVVTSSKKLTDPSWVALGPKALYAISEQTKGTVSALDPTTLAVRNTVATGSGPAHINLYTDPLHPDSPFLLTSLYDGGATVTHRLDATTGNVGAAIDTHDQKQGKTSNAHEVVTDPTGKYLLAVDLGRDAIFVYTLDTVTGKLTLVGGKPVALATGSGPRHLVFHPNGQFAYVANELGGTVTVLSWANGVLTPGQTINANGTSTAANNPGEITISADGRFVYVSNRGPNTVGVFAVSAGGAKLTNAGNPSCGGKNPRSLSLDASGKWIYVANQDSGTVNWLPINTTTGLPGKSAGSLKISGAAQILLP